jgi:hypothetical protein
MNQSEVLHSPCRLFSFLELGFGLASVCREAIDSIEEISYASKANEEKEAREIGPSESSALQAYSDKSRRGIPG